MSSPSKNTAHPPDAGRTLVIMAKAPRPGMVKTRLTRTLSVEAAAELYCCFLKDTVTLACSLSDVQVAILCPASDVAELTRFARGAVDVVPQMGDGLAAGLTSVFAHFTAPGPQRVVAFNSDSPHLPASILEAAFESLSAHEVVVGPTHDGGYYLVGANAAHPTLFDSDGMGTKSALDALLARARAMQLSVAFTHAFYDVDVEGDLARLAAELQLAPARAPQTALWLQQRRRAAEKLRAATENR